MRLPVVDYIPAIFYLRVIFISALLMIPGLYGCSMFYQIAGSASEAGVEDELNGWLGASKQEQFEAMGKPENCMIGPDGREVCQWPELKEPPSSSPGAKRMFRYEQDGTICGWTYISQWANQSKGWCE